MLTLRQTAKTKGLVGEQWPVIAGLEPLYASGFKPRAGQLIQIVGRPGSQKSGLALWICSNLGWDTMYFAGDMSATSMVSRLGSQACNTPLEPGPHASPFQHLSEDQQEALDEIDNINFVYGAPITWKSMTTEINANVALTGRYPRLIVIDNLQDFENCSSEYSAQNDFMSHLKAFVSETGIGVIILHHATDKGTRVANQPFEPPTRNETKNGLAEKPEIILSIGVDPRPRGGDGDYIAANIAIIKQRDGACDSSASNSVCVYLRPSVARWYKTEDDATKDRDKGVIT